MKYKLTVFLLLFLSTQTFAETYSFRVKDTLIERLFPQSAIMPSNPQVWIDFFRVQCGLNYSSADEMEGANIYCSDRPNVGANFPTVAGLTKTAGDLYLYDNQLTNIDSLSSLKSVGNNILLHRNQLTNVDGLRGLETVGSYIYLQSNKLLNVDGLSSLVSIGGVFSMSNNDLLNVDGLLGLETVGSHIYFQNNKLLNVDGLSSLVSVGGELTLSSNDLRNVNGLKDLEVVHGKIDLRSNQNLTDISGLRSINSSVDIVYLDNREYTGKLPATSYLCLNFGKVSGTIKSNACES
jgi:hypothetical protein